jgi:UDP-glucose 4-epimerase
MIQQELEDRFKGARVFITGGLGFIGSNLALRLADLGAVVTLADSLPPDLGGDPFNIAGYENRLRVHSTDLRDEAGIADLIRYQEFIFNLAGQVSHVQSMLSPATDADVNVRGQLMFLEACRRFNPGAKIVLSSTRQVYGTPCYLPVNENHPLNPIDINAVNKLAGEWYHILYGRIYGLQPVILRMANVYGMRMRVKDNRKTFVGWWIRQLLDGEAITIYGDGRQVRDLLYVDDAVHALLLAALCPGPGGRIFNVGGNEPVRLVELAQLMIDLNGGGRYQTVPFPPERKRIEIGDYYTDSTKIRRELGWQPTIRLRDGLARTLDFYRKNREHYR